MKVEPLFLKPAFKDYIWGGKKLKDIFNKKVENTECTAESWEVSTNKNGESVIRSGEYEGKTLTELYNDIKLRNEIFGTRCENMKEFPLLIKFIDASKSLSVQVHPDDEYAKKVENANGKTEMWYILDCEPGAQIICGMKEGVTKEELRKCIKLNKVENCLNYIDVKKGDAIYIPSGTIHALLGKTLVAEVQQNSDITYRVYDWGRVGKDGKPRELHVDKALDVIETDKEPQIKNIGTDLLKISVVNSKYFCVDKINVNDSFEEILSKESFKAFNVIDGVGKLKVNETEYEIKKGDSFIIPACVEKVEFQGKLELLESYI